MRAPPLGPEVSRSVVLLLPQQPRMTGRLRRLRRAQVCTREHDARSVDAQSAEAAAALGGRAGAERVHHLPERVVLEPVVAALGAEAVHEHPSLVRLEVGREQRAQIARELGQVEDAAVVVIHLQLRLARRGQQVPAVESARREMTRGRPRVGRVLYELSRWGMHTRTSAHATVM